MSELVQISPEALSIANTYLTTGNADETSRLLNVPLDIVHNHLARKDVKNYISSVWADQGYRNRNKLFAVLDKIIDSKLEEALETEVYTSKDLLEVIKLYHSMKIDEMKQDNLANGGGGFTKTQTNVAIIDGGGSFGQGNYGKLMEKLLGQDL